MGTARQFIEQMRGRLVDALDDDGFEDELTAEDLAAALPNLFGHQRRRVWRHDGRAHVELREFSIDQVPAIHAALAAAAAKLGRAELHDVNTVTGRAIFSDPSESLTAEYFADVADEAEEACGFLERPFALNRPKYPADSEPIARLLVELAADSGAVALGTLLKAAGFKPTRGEFDLAALVTLVENTPRLRGWLEERLSATSVDVGLGTAGAFLQAVGNGPVGPAIDLFLRTLRLRAELARRWAWLSREAELSRTVRIDVTAEFTGPERPQPLPEGDVDRYADEALFASLGGFAVGLLDTENLEAAFAPLFTGLPKAAKYGRHAFLAELTRVIGERNGLVMRPAAMELLERVSTVVVDARVLGRDSGLDPHAHNLVLAARRARLDLVLVGGDAEMREKLAPSSWVELERDAWVDTGMARQIAQLQREGQVVLAVSASARRALLAADVGVGLCQESLPPWEAALLMTGDLDDATFIFEACAEARAVSDESIALAAVGAALGGLTAVGRGVEKRTPQRVMIAVNAAAIAALGNGVRRLRTLERRARPIAAAETSWHRMSTSEVCAALESSSRGLASDEARRRLAAPEAEPGETRKFLGAVGREVMNPFTPILAGGAALSAIVGSAGDAAIVASAVALSATIGGAERYASERSIAGLEAAERIGVRTMRDGEPVEIDRDALVVGDVLLLRAGEMVPADCRILDGHGVEVDQSSLTGESLTVRKSPRASRADDISDRSSMLFDGSVVTNGEVSAIVVAVGDATEAARADTLAEAPPETGVEVRLRELAELTIPAAGLSGLMLAAVGLVQGRDLRQILGSSVGLAVASVPEGLPLLTTMAQLAAARRMARRGIIVRNPRTIEALGRIDTLCVDKTGTLTEGRIRLHGVSDGAEVEAPVLSATARAILTAALRATPSDGRKLRHATDRAIVEGAREAGLSADPDGSWTPTFTLPFGHDRAYHAVQGTDGADRILYVKGAPETVLLRCNRRRVRGRVARLRPAVRDELLRHAEELAARGLRVLCVATRPAPEADLTDDSVTDLVFGGFVTLSDPIRRTSADAVRALRQGSIRVLMITGDHPQTAHRIGLTAGIVDEDETADRVVLSGKDVDSLSDEELARTLLGVRIVARATPLHKVRIIRALQGAGHVVGMTGDGGNDASAIRLADVGIALGRESSRAAREAADMIVLDPHLETITDGIAEGRAMWPSVRDAVALLVGGNLGEIGLAVVSGILGEKGGLNTRQLLLVNLLTDIAPAMTVALRPPTNDELRESLAHDFDEPLGAALEEQIATRAVATGGSAAVAWAIARVLGSEERASTVALLALVGAQLGQTIASGRQTQKTLIAGVASAAMLLGIVQTPGLNKMFGCRAVGPIGLTIATASSIGATYAARDGQSWRQRAGERLRRFQSRRAEQIGRAHV